jgi:phosphonopyruvate decarboxylase
MTRERAVQIVTQATPDSTVFVSTTGKLSRELNEIREKAHEAGRDFLTVGGMGHASAIALGVALKTTDRCIVCLDGDGAALMHLGIMAMVGESKPENFVHVILNNGTHESVGAQPIAAKLVSFTQLAESLHYKSVVVLDSEEELRSFFLEIDEIAKPCLVEILINSESRMNLSRPSNSPKENKIKFAKFMGVENIQ